MVGAATRRVAQEEALALVHLIEGERRKAMVVVVLADGDEVWADRAASAVTSLPEAEHLLRGLDLIRARIAAKIEEARP